MKIIYKNYRGGEYHTFWSPINGCRPKRIIGFRQKQPNEFVEIPIYDSESDALPIYTELITLDTIMNVCFSMYTLTTNSSWNV